MVSHPTLNYFAAGYDNGLCVLKLEKERQASLNMEKVPRKQLVPITFVPKIV